jgi:hypothetical protein
MLGRSITKERTMRHLIGIALVVVGGTICAVGFGPLFFGNRCSVSRCC